jgi:hypothetical protein
MDLIDLMTDYHFADAGKPIYSPFADHFAGIGNMIERTSGHHFAEAGKMVMDFIRSVFFVARRHWIIARRDGVLAAKSAIEALRGQLSTALIGQHGFCRADRCLLGSMKAGRAVSIVALVFPSAVCAAGNRSVLWLAHIRLLSDRTDIERFGLL